MATYTCKGCKPIDASIIDAYVALIGATENANNSAANAEEATTAANNAATSAGNAAEQATNAALSANAAAAAANAAGITQAEASVDSNTGTPSVDVSLVNKKLSLSFHNIKGEKGEKGDRGDGAIPVINDLVTGGTNAALSAEMGKTLNNTKQATLVSGTNIKTVNGESLLGEGNIIAGDPNAVKYVEQTLTDAQKTQARTNIDAYQKPSTGIPATDLTSTAQASLGKADTAYQKPSSGIPKTDLEIGVQGSLDLADSAIQARPAGEVDPTITPADYATTEELGELEAEITQLENGSIQNYVPGSYIKADGTFAEDTNWGYTDFIPYSSGDVLWKYSNGTNKAAATLVFYNASRQFISGAYWGANDASGAKTITAADIATYAVGAAYFRASIVLDESPQIKIGEDVVWTRQENVVGLVQVKNGLQLLKNGQEQNYTSGKYLNSAGYEIVNANWGYTNYLVYTPGRSITWKYSDGTKLANAAIVFYDSSKNVLTFWGANDASGAKTISSSAITTYAPNAAYIRASIVIDESPRVISGDSILWVPVEEMDGVATIRRDLDELEEQIDLDGIVSANRFKESATVSIGTKIGTLMPKPNNTYLTLIHASDIHGDVERTKRIIEFANAYSNIDAVMFTGDMETSTWADDGFEQTFGAFYDKTTKPVFPLVGNHEIGNRRTIQDNSNQAVGARFITPYMSRCGGVQGGTDAGYYYRDFIPKKIRLIVLNEYEMPRIPNEDNTELKYSIWDRWLSQSQCDWLISTLNGIESGWSVVICMHQLIDVFIKYDNEFKGRVAYSSADVSNSGQDTLLQDIIDAYITKTTLSKTYSHTIAPTSDVPPVSINADFTNANGTFICYMNGHTHNDGIGQSSISSNKQVNLNVTCGSSDTQSIAVYDDLYRNSEGISQDAFNLIAFDTDKKEIRILRIGANVSADMRRRDFAIVKY